MKCWICREPADTGEHKIKKSLLVNLYGEGPYTGSGALSHVKAGKAHSLQGPGAKRLTYPKSLCADCNNSRTQPFDRAFDIFSKYVIQNEENIVRRRVIDFASVYGSTFAIEQRHLYKYCAKLFGCELASNGFDVPEDVRSALDQRFFQTGLRVSFAVNEDKRLLLRSPRERGVGIGELLTSQRNLENKDDPVFRWHTFFSFIHIFYWYLWEMDGPFGAEWIANSRYVYLGSFAPLTDQQRAEFRLKSKDLDQA